MTSGRRGSASCCVRGPHHEASGRAGPAGRRGPQSDAVFPVLADGVIVLRSLTHQDAAARNATSASGTPAPTNSSELRGEPPPRRTGFGRGDLSDGVFPHWRGRGIARRAVLVVCEWLRSQPRCTTAVIRVAPANVRSHVVAEAAGFTRTGATSAADDEELIRYERPLERLRSRTSERPDRSASSGPPSPASVRQPGQSRGADGRTGHGESVAGPRPEPRGTSRGVAR